MWLGDIPYREKTATRKDSVVQLNYYCPSKHITYLVGLLLVLLTVGGVGLTPFFRNKMGERLGDLPAPGGLGPAEEVLADSFSGDGDEPAVPVAELRLEVARPTVVSKCRNLWIGKWICLRETDVACVCTDLKRGPSSDAADANKNASGQLIQEEDRLSLRNRSSSTC